MVAQTTQAPIEINIASTNFRQVSVYGEQVLPVQQSEIQ
jgi:hypothetical protein